MSRFQISLNLSLGDFREKIKVETNRERHFKLTQCQLKIEGKVIIKPIDKIKSD